MSISEAQNELRKIFSSFESPDDKWKFLLQIAKEHAGMQDKPKEEKFLVKGCAARMFLVPEFKDGLLFFYMDTEGGESNPMLSRGLGALALRIYNGQKPADILSANPDFFKEIGLEIGLTPTRANGFAGLLKQIYLYAKAFSLLR